MALNDDHLIEKTIRSESLFKGHFISLQRDHVALPDGTEATRDFVLHPGAVAIIALLPDGRVVLERQYRHPVGQVLWEFPAGKLDPTEDPLHCAQRELMEETGYLASEWAVAGKVNLAPAYCDEVLHIYFARGLTGGLRKLDPGEFIEVCLLTPQELFDLALAGKVMNSTAMICSFWLQNYLRGDCNLNWQSLTSAVNKD
jgi:ADP-ribose pyrophosphatase